MLLAAADERPLLSAIAVKRAHALRRIPIDTFTDIAEINSGSTAGTQRPMRAGHLRAGHWDELRPFVTDAVAHAELAPDDSTFS